MSGTWIGITAGLGYIVGYLVAWTIATCYWFSEFGEEWEGVAWGALLAILWPIFALGTILAALGFIPAYCVKHIAGRIA